MKEDLAGGGLTMLDIDHLFCDMVLESWKQMKYYDFQTQILFLN